MAASDTGSSVTGGAFGAPRRGGAWLGWARGFGMARL